jgi:hypothetical protein
MRYLEDTLKPGIQEDASLKTAEVVKDEAVVTPMAMGVKASGEAVGSDDLPSPWLLLVSFAALISVALFVRVLKALVMRATRPSI